MFAMMRGALRWASAGLLMVAGLACGASGSSDGAGSGSCGGLGQPCCPNAEGMGGVCNGAGCCDFADPSGPTCVAHGTSCTTSGGYTQVCSAGSCTGCGLVFDPCCAGSTCHGSPENPAVCDTSDPAFPTCGPCGDIDQPCCPGDTCPGLDTAGNVLACNKTHSPHLCFACGLVGEPCCPLGFANTNAMGCFESYSCYYGSPAGPMGQCM